jgi:hypothetical protein
MVKEFWLREQLAGLDCKDLRGFFRGFHKLRDELRTKEQTFDVLFLQFKLIFFVLILKRKFVPSRSKTWI